MLETRQTRKEPRIYTLAARPCFEDDNITGTLPKPRVEDVEEREELDDEVKNVVMEEENGEINGEELDISAPSPEFEEPVSIETETKRAYPTSLFLDDLNEMRETGNYYSCEPMEEDPETEDESRAEESSESILESSEAETEAEESFSDCEEDSPETIDQSRKAENESPVKDDSMQDVKLTGQIIKSSEPMEESPENDLPMRKTVSMETGEEPVQPTEESLKLVDQILNPNAASPEANAAMPTTKCLEPVEESPAEEDPMIKDETPSENAIISQSESLKLEKQSPVPVEKCSAREAPTSSNEAPETVEKSPCRCAQAPKPAKEFPERLKVDKDQCPDEKNLRKRESESSNARNGEEDELNKMRRIMENKPKTPNRRQRLKSPRLIFMEAHARNENCQDDSESE